MLKAYYEYKDSLTIGALIESKEIDILERYMSAASGFVEKPDWATEQFGILSTDLKYRSGPALLFKAVVDISYAKTCYDGLFSKKTRTQHATGNRTYLELIHQGQTMKEIEAELSKKCLLEETANELRHFLWPGEVDPYFGIANSYKNVYGNPQRTLQPFLNILDVPATELHPAWSFFDIPIVRTFCKNIITDDSYSYRQTAAQLARDVYVKKGNWFLPGFIRHNPTLGG